MEVWRYTEKKRDDVSDGLFIIFSRSILIRNLRHPVSTFQPYVSTRICNASWRLQSRGRFCPKYRRVHRGRSGAMQIFRICGSLRFALSDDSSSHIHSLKTYLQKKRENNSCIVNNAVKDSISIDE
jgi:hypothetical protein